MHVEGEALRAGETRMVALTPEEADLAEWVELRVRERITRRVQTLNALPTKPASVARAPIRPGDSEVELAIPGGLSPGWRGAAMQWSYELALVDARSKDVASLSVDVVGGPTLAAGEVLQTKGDGSRRGPAKPTALVGPPGIDVGQSWFIGIALLTFAGAGAFFINDGLENGETPAVIFGSVLTIVCVLLAVLVLSGLRPSMRRLNGVSIHLDRSVVTFGSSIEVTLDPVTTTGVEVGIVLAECVTNTTGQHGRLTADVTPVIENYLPYEGAPVTLEVPSDAPGGFKGSRTQLRWAVRARIAENAGGSGGVGIEVLRAPEALPTSPDASSS
ncbi:MAG: hypothetical protein R2733_02685 [Acidimicrobiales bacterium]